MDYENKYRELLARLQKAKENEEVNDERYCCVIDDIVPELKEDEDELTWLKNYISEEAYYLSMDIRDNKDSIKLQKLQKSLAWLEKQGEQKPTQRKDFISIPFGAFDSELVNETITIPDGYVATIEGNRIHIKREDNSATETIKEEKVDKPFDYENANIVQKDFVPKFEFGDWIVQENIGVYQVIQVCESWYEVVDNKGKGYSIGFDKEHMLRYWTIADAQDGDVLVASDGSIFIFAGVVDCACKYYVSLTTRNYVKINKEVKGGYWETSRAVHPATKEQCALLFQKMREEEYEWDSEKKKLKKIMESNETN